MRDPHFQVSRCYNLHEGMRGVCFQGVPVRRFRLFSFLLGIVRGMTSHADDHHTACVARAVRVFLTF